jgi:flagellar motor switch protein FliM
MTGMLHTVCEVDVISVEEQSFGEFNNSLPDPVVLGVVDMDPLNGSLIVEVSSALVYGFVARLFGGTADYSQSEKAFTEIETSIIESIMFQMMQLLKESWEKIADVNPVLTRIEYSSQFTQITDMNEPSAIVTMNVQLDEIQGMITICIPHLAIQPISKQLTTVNWTLASASGKQQDSKEDLLRGQLNNTYVTMKARFNETETTLHEILNMRVGDVILINHSIRDYIRVDVENIEKFKGVVGTDVNKYAVQIAEIIKENQNLG